MSSFYKFTSSKSEIAVARILTFVAENQQVTIKQIAQALNLSQTTITAYVKKLIADGDMYCSAPSLRLPDGPWISALYAVVESGNSTTHAHRDPQQVVIKTTKWTPNHVRNLLDCYLFGFPETMQPT